MRPKFVLLLAALAALVIGGGTADAALQSAVKVKAKFRHAGGAGTLSLQLVNINDAPLAPNRPLTHRRIDRYLFNGGLVPQPITKLLVRSHAARYNRHALPYCRVYFNGRKMIPTRADGITGTENLTYVPGRRNSRALARVCPKRSIIARGRFTAVVGTPGMPYVPALSGVLIGSVVAYNYQPNHGDKIAAVVRLHVTKPVVSTQYLYVGVSRHGLLTANIPSRAEIPPNLDRALMAGQLSLTSIDVKLTAPRPKRRHHSRHRGHPIFTIKSFRNIDFFGRIVR